MTNTVDPAQRAAALPTDAHQGQVTLINSFVVPSDRDADFMALWAKTSAFFRTQPGFVGLRMHRALSPDASHRYVNVAVWDSVEQFGAAHDTEQFRVLVADPGLRDFPSSPVLYEVIAQYDSEPVGA
jgi:heme-degrading monooxygenase HmoA